MRIDVSQQFTLDTDGRPAILEMINLQAGRSRALRKFAQD